MSTLNQIGIDQKKADALVGKLNTLLANYQVYYTNLRGFHWNLKGDKFFELHIKFEEEYNNVAEQVDAVAERILTLGGIAVNSFSEYLKISDIKEVKFQPDGKAAVANILESLKTLLVKQRELLELSAEANDEEIGRAHV